MLEARDLWIAPPGAHEPVVRECSLTLGAGEWLAVSGPNGCGKSTLALALAGLIMPQRGTLTWEGRALSDHAARPGERPVLAVLQDPTSQLLQPTVREELLFTAMNLGHDPASRLGDAQRWAGRFGLGAVLEQDPHTLSAGNQQLVLLLAALIARPGLLIADEAGAHLDPEFNARVLAAIDAERAGGMSVVWVTQREADRAIIGRDLVMGSPVPTAVPRGDAMAGGSGSATLLELVVTAARGASGPRVSTPSGFSLRIPERGVVGLTGANGTGKSVLLACAVGLTHCDQVEVRWSGARDVAPLLVSEHPETLIFEERVDAELRFAAVSRGRSRADVERDCLEMLAHLGFDPAALTNRRTWSLSSGEKRLIELVAALAAPATLLALDEPTAGLDPGRRAALADLVGRRARESAVLVASQDQAWLELLGADVHRVGD